MNIRDSSWNNGDLGYSNFFKLNPTTHLNKTFIFCRQDIVLVCVSDAIFYFTRIRSNRLIRFKSVFIFLKRKQSMNIVQKTKGP